MKTKWMSAVVLTTLVAGGLFAADVAHKQSRTMQIFMRQKLGYAQKVFEGITLENYNLVLSNGVPLSLMTQSNVWMKLQTPDFVEKTDHYRADITVMLAAARNANTPDLLNAYARVTADCVDCHQAFRRDQLPAIRLKKAPEKAQ